MKVLATLFIASLVVLSHQKWKRPANLTVTLAEWRRWAEPHLPTCMRRTGVNPNLIDGFYARGEISDDPCFKCTISCISQKLKTTNSTGFVDIKVLEKIPAVDEAIARKCAMIQGSDICQHSYEFLLCLIGILSGKDPYPGAATAVGVLPVVPAAESINAVLPNIVSAEPPLLFQYLPFTLFN